MPKCSSQESYRLIHEGSLALSRISANGVRINEKYLTEKTTQLKQEISELETTMKKDRIWKIWERTYGMKAEIGKRQQLSKVLHEKLGYKIHDYTEKSKELEKKHWRAKTDKTALERIKEPFVQQFLKIEGKKKTLSTYFIGLEREMVLARDGCWYIHPIYNLNIASTYRSTCTAPNFQNVPKRDEEMYKLVRQCYLPHPGHHLVEIDFSTLEVRIAYCYHQDPVMRKYLTDKTTDMHRDMASELFLLDKEEIARWGKKTCRDSAKNQFVFPEFYGSVYFQCAKNIWERMKRQKWEIGTSDSDQVLQTVMQNLKKKGISKLGKCDPELEAVKGTFEYHVQQVEKKLWSTFKVYSQWKREWFDAYMRTGSFEMLTGFVVNTGHKRNDVINYPVQGSAFHCLLWCLIELDKWLIKHDMKSKIIGEIHDSMVLSVHPSELQEVLHRAHWIMTYLLPQAWKWINIPLEIEIDVAPVDEDWTKQKQWIEHPEDGYWCLKG